MVNVTPLKEEEPEIFDKVNVEEGVEETPEEIMEAAEEIAEELLEEAADDMAEEIAEELVEVAEKIAEEENDDDFEDEEEEDEDDDDYEEDVSNETVLERIVALKGAIPPSYRYGASSIGSSVYSAVSTALKFSGSAIWIITTSSLLLGVPLTLSVISEQQLIEMEKEMNLSQTSNEVLAPGAESGFQQPPVAPTA